MSRIPTGLHAREHNYKWTLLAATFHQTPDEFQSALECSAKVWAKAEIERLIQDLQHTKTEKYPNLKKA